MNHQTWRLYIHNGLHAKNCAAILRPSHAEVKAEPQSEGQRNYVYILCQTCIDLGRQRCASEFVHLRINLACTKKKEQLNLHC